MRISVALIAIITVLSGVYGYATWEPTNIGGLSLIGETVVSAGGGLVLGTILALIVAIVARGIDAVFPKGR